MAYGIEINLLNKLPHNFYDKIKGTNWQERQSALDSLERLVSGSVPKFESGDYGDLMRELLKVIGSDKNIILVATAARIVNQLCKGLSKGFQPYASQTVKICIEKFKEKKPNVIAALRETIDNAFYQTNFESNIDEIIGALYSKNPAVKAETALFLSRVIRRESGMSKKLQKQLVTPLISIINDTLPEVRNAGFEAMGVLMRVVSESVLLSYLNAQNVDSRKLAKIKEHFEKAVVIGDCSVVDAPSTSTDASVVAQSNTKKTAGSIINKRQSSIRTSGTTAGNKRTATGTLKPPAQGRKTTASVSKKCPAVSKSSTVGLTGSQPTEVIISDDVVEEKANSIFGEDCLTKLGSSNWKDRLLGVERVDKFIRCQQGDIPVQLIVKTLLRKPGLKDNVFNVLKQKFDTLQYMVENCTFSKLCAEICLQDVIEKIGDNKTGESAQLLLTAMAEACTLEFVAGRVLQTAFTQKNPKTQTESLNWFNKMIREFGLKIPPEEFMKFIRIGYQASNPSTRTAAINFTATLYLYLGDAPLKHLLQDEKPALVALIDAEIGQIREKQPPPPIRGVEKCGHVVKQCDNDLQGAATDNVDSSSLNSADKKEQEEAPNNVTKSCPSSDFLCDNNRPTESSFHNVDQEMSLSTTLEDNHQGVIEENRTETLHHKSEHEPRRTMVIHSSAGAYNIPSSNSNSKLASAAENCSIPALLDRISSETIDYSTKIQTWDQIAFIVQDPTKELLLQRHFDTMIGCMSLQFQLLFNQVSSNDQLIQLRQRLLTTLISLCQQFSSEIKNDSLKELLHVLISVKLNKQLSLNAIVSIKELKNALLNSCSKTRLFCVFMRLLRDCIEKGDLTGDYCQYILRRIEKIISHLQLNNSINDYSLESILLELHLFCNKFPKDTWKRKACDRPRKTVDNLLYTLCQLKGVSILHHLAPSINDDSELKALILEYIASLESNTDQSTNSEQNLYENCEEEVDLIEHMFNRIQNLDREAIGQFYDFIQTHQDIDLTLYCKNINSVYWRHATVVMMNFATAKNDLKMIDFIDSHFNSRTKIDRHNNDNDEDEVKHLFRKINDSDFNRKIVVELYDFLRVNPDIKLAAYFKDYDETFHSFVTAALKNIGYERNELKGQSRKPQLNLAIV